MMTQPTGDVGVQFEITCPSWCTDRKHEHDKSLADRNCWGPDNYVGLSLEHGYPRDYRPVGNDQLLINEFDLPRIGPSAYRPAHGAELVYLHVYRPHENKYLDLDTNVKLTAPEARMLAEALIAVADQIGGQR